MEGGAWTCRLCQRAEGADVRFRSSVVPRNGGMVAKRRVCYDCEKAVRKGHYRQAKESTPLRTVLFVPDCHVPFHDVGAWSVLLRAAAILKPHTIVLLGDFADFYAVSFHDKSPKRVNNLRWEVEQINEALDQLDAIGAERKVYVSGNHEYRLDRFLGNVAPQLADWPGLSVPEAFRLKERGWSWVAYQETFHLGKLHITHDLNRSGQNAHRHAGDKYRGSAIIGHTHAMELSVVGGIEGHSALRAMFGWLGNYTDIDYRHQTLARAEWVHGFGVGYEETATGVVHVQPVPIVGGRCVVAGRLVT